MLYHAKNGTLPLGNTDMDYIRFGRGARTLLILPGLGDGLRTVKGTALPMALMYRALAKDFTVYAFSRKNGLPEGHTTRDMARDVSDAMDVLGIGTADVLGVSMGGMIAQHLAADYPERVGKLVLAVTCSRPNEIMTGSVEQWMDMARQGDHTALMDSNVRKIYSRDYYRQNRWLVPFMGKVTKPKSYDRFFIQAEACLNHTCYDNLCRILCPTLVIGGEQDEVVGCEASRELAQRIPHGSLLTYPQWGHGVYEEEKGFNAAVLSWLKEEEPICTL